MTVIGRLSATPAGDDASAGLSGLAAVSGAPKSGDRFEETLAVPQRHAKLIEVALSQIGQDFSIDFALAKRGVILTETEAAQPSPDVHDCIRLEAINDGLIERACPGYWTSKDRFGSN